MWQRAVLCGVMAGILAFAGGCGTNDKVFSSDARDLGSADFASFVAIGNSLTAGYQSAALSSVTNAFSFPRTIATQAGVGTFVQPDIAHPGLGQYASLGAGILELDMSTLTNATGPTIAPAPFTTTSELMLLNAGTHLAPYNNLGIPGLLAIQSATTAVDPANPNAQNPMVDVVLRNPAFGSTQLNQALALSPTIATVWLGNNDVLGYAASGGTLAIPGLPPGPVPASMVGDAIGAVVKALKAQGCDVVIANVPDVAAVPYFTTLPPYISSGGSKFYLWGPGGARLSEGDLLLLTAKDGLFRGVGSVVTNPVPDEHVLSVAEQKTVQDAVDAYNDAIALIADENDCVLVNMNAFFDDLSAKGYDAGGVRLGTGFISGGLISLDGVHPNSVGYTLVANEFIRRINEHFGANIPLASIGDAIGN
jgi:hypothetical protein